MLKKTGISPQIMIKLLHVPKPVIVFRTRPICLVLVTSLFNFCMYSFQRLFASKKSLERSIWVRADVWLFCPRPPTGTTSVPECKPCRQHLRHPLTCHFCLVRLRFFLKLCLLLLLHYLNCFSFWSNSDFTLKSLWTSLYWTWPRPIM